MRKQILFAAILNQQATKKLHLVIASYVLVKSAQNDHRHHAREEKHDDQGIEDAEPLDVGVRHGVQDIVPARRPADVSIAFLWM
ncbi:hypothetical protein E2C01_034184 [Portunus trituberculatus]|uniref:Uncharacterized protein n=1 Tax=Portunus trituberculatus TaxID=210409 RepID=A0A5B7F0T4_PORTR|nr:hypothetical protein [Portunus trituberculatus]